MTAEEKLLPIAIEAYDGDTTSIELHRYDSGLKVVSPLDWLKVGDS
jgi:hypothetical protein